MLSNLKRTKYLMMSIIEEMLVDAEAESRDRDPEQYIIIMFHSVYLYSVHYKLYITSIHIYISILN